MLVRIWLLFALTAAPWLTEVLDADDRPNVILFIADDVSWKSAGDFAIVEYLAVEYDPKAAVACAHWLLPIPLPYDR